MSTVYPCGPGRQAELGVDNSEISGPVASPRPANAETVGSWEPGLSGPALLTIFEAKSAPTPTLSPDFLPQAGACKPALHSGVLGSKQQLQR